MNKKYEYVRLYWALQQKQSTNNSHITTSFGSVYMDNETVYAHLKGNKPSHYYISFVMFGKSYGTYTESPTADKALTKVIELMRKEAS